jgi:hypothetical protein
MVMKNELLYEIGDPGNCIYFIANGKVQCTLPCGDELSSLDFLSKSAIGVLMEKERVCGRELMRGDHFGEYCILSKLGIRTETIKVLSDSSELYQLSKEKMWHCLLNIEISERKNFILKLMTACGAVSFIDRARIDEAFAQKESDAESNTIQKKSDNIDKLNVSIMSDEDSSVAALLKFAVDIFEIVLISFTIMRAKDKKMFNEYSNVENNLAPSQVIRRQERILNTSQ